MPMESQRRPESLQTSHRRPETPRDSNFDAKIVSKIVPEAIRKPFQNRRNFMCVLWCICNIFLDRFLIHFLASLNVFSLSITFPLTQESIEIYKFFCKCHWYRTFVGKTGSKYLGVNCWMHFNIRFSRKVVIKNSIISAKSYLPAKSCFSSLGYE